MGRVILICIWKRLELSGGRPRCWWCGKKINDHPRQIVITFNKKQYETFVCSPEHEQEILRAYVYVQKTIPRFLIGMLAGLILLPLGNGSVMSALGLLVLGGTLFACPFTTPQTTEVIGLKRSFRVGRIAGITLSAGALGLLIFQLSR